MPRPILAAALLGAALLAGLAAGPAWAVVGGTEAGDAGTVMVLSARGGVCSGVVLAQNVVLTAGHCAAGGAEHRVHYREGGEPVLVPLAATAVHPGYDAGAIAGRRRSIDLALVRTATPLPARFLPAALTGAAPASGTMLTLGGYGVAREGDGRSSGTYRIARLPVVEPYGPSRILVWLKGERAGACQGDSGGPVAAEGGAVVAVTSWATGDGRAACGAVTQGVLVGPQRAWIDATLARWSATARWD